MVTNTRPAPPWKPPVAVCKSPGGQMTSQQYQLRQQAKEEGKKAVASEVPSEYRDLADIGSEMFDPLTCLKNGIPWDARAESKSEKKSPRKVADKGLKIGF